MLLPNLVSACHESSDMGFKVGSRHAEKVLTEVQNWVTVSAFTSILYNSGSPVSKMAVSKESNRHARKISVIQV